MAWAVQGSLNAEPTPDPARSHTGCARPVITDPNHAPVSNVREKGRVYLLLAVCSSGPFVNAIALA